MTHKASGTIRTKESAAKSSVLAAAGLVVTKLVVGVMTGSLGILAEAAHSGLDLIAAGVTFLAVRHSAKPADLDHPYGHGKVENISALFETLLLLLTCFWISSEAIHRLMSGKVDMEVTVWSFAVMGLSIVVDISRSRMLLKAARDHQSQALEADALHFSTDIWSSAVVILGLGCVALGGLFPKADFLHYADALAALSVAVIVVYVSLKMGRRAINELMDAAPAGLRERLIARVEQIPGVLNCHRVRVRGSGAQCFIDLHVLMDSNKTLQEAHHLTDIIEVAIRELAPGADIIVHPEPK